MNYDDSDSDDIPSPPPLVRDGAFYMEEKTICMCDENAIHVRMPVYVLCFICRDGKLDYVRCARCGQSICVECHNNIHEVKGFYIRCPFCRLPFQD